LYANSFSSPSLDLAPAKAYVAMYITPDVHESIGEFIYCNTHVNTVCGASHAPVFNPTHAIPSPRLYRSVDA
jgi:hypothetical protein